MAAKDQCSPLPNPHNSDHNSDHNPDPAQPQAIHSRINADNSLQVTSASSNLSSSSSLPNQDPPPPPPPPPPRPSLPPSILSSSNSTANLFLGGLRRSWMLDAPAASTSTSAAHRTRRRPLPPRSLSIVTKHTHQENAGPVSTVSDDAPPSADPPSMSSFAPSLTATTTQSQPPPPQSDPPGESLRLQQEPAEQPPRSQQRPLPPPLHLTTTGAAIVPSPRLATTTTTTPVASATAGPQPSPTGTSTPRDERSHAPRTPLPSPPPTAGPGPRSQYPQDQLVQGERAAHPPAPLSLTSPVPTPTPGEMSAADTLRFPSHPASHAPSESPRNMFPPTPSAHQPPVYSSVPVVDAEFFTLSSQRLGVYSQHRDRLVGDLSSKVIESPRIQLLQTACGYRDTLYMAIHQVYCIHSVAPMLFYQISGFSTPQADGLTILRQLLVDNQRLSPDFLQWVMNFPAPITILMHSPVYRLALDQAAQCLARLSEQWPAFDLRVRSRDYPPLVDELVINLGMSSRTLQNVVFLAMARRLPILRPEADLEAIWERDVAHQSRRSTQLVTQAQIRWENEQIIHAYQLVPALPPPESSGPLIAAAAPGRRPRSRRPSTHDPRGSASPHLQASVQRAPGGEPQRPPGSPARAFHPQSYRHPPPVSHAAASPRMAAFAPSTGPAPSSPHGWAGQQQQQQQQQQQLRIERHADGAAAVTTRPGRARMLPSFNPQVSRAPAPPVYPPLLPPPGVMPPAMSRVNPFRHALHQAHLRDPYSRLVVRGLDGEEGEGELFPYLSAFPVGPTPLGPRQCAFAWEFALSPADCQRFPQFLGTPVGQRPSQIVRDGSQIYRLRCVRVSPSTTAVSPSAWSVADAVWPSLAYIFVNGVELPARRKLYYGKDLPLDITRHLRPGTNTVTLHLIRNAAESKDQFYAAAVEVLDVTSFTRAIQLAGSLPAAQCRERIRQRLHPATRDDDDDDDVSIVSEELTVSLVDPFTAQIFDRPVRGQRCAHLECFDHETWIRTRAAKSDRQALKDDWKCPICGRDARPQNLVIDGFLSEVRNTLAATNRLDGARAIQVKADGSWALKAETTQQHTAGGPDVSREPPKRKSVSGDDRSPSLTQRPKLEQARSQTQTTGDVRSLSTEVISLD